MYQDYNHVLQRLKEERTQCGLTQRQLCRYAEIPQSAFSRAETGCRRFSYPALKRSCASGMDIFYVFTGNKAENVLGFLELSETTSEELLCHLGTVYIYASATRPLNQSRTYSEISSQISIEKIRKQLEYISYVSGNTKANQNIFFCVRNYYGYTQEKMTDLLGIDIKKLRNLEKGRRFPDSELIWKLYDQFHISPAFILKDARGLWNELNYVLGMLQDDDREAMLRILENGHALIWT